MLCRKKVGPPKLPCSALRNTFIRNRNNRENPRERKTSLPSGPKYPVSSARAHVRACASSLNAQAGGQEKEKAAGGPPDPFTSDLSTGTETAPAVKRPQPGQQTLWRPPYCRALTVNVLLARLLPHGFQSVQQRLARRCRKKRLHRADSALQENPGRSRKSHAVEGASKPNGARSSPDAQIKRCAPWGSHAPSCSVAGQRPSGFWPRQCRATHPR